MNPTRSSLTRDLLALGVAPGDLLYVHSSLKAVGWLENGPDDVIDALLDALGPEGTLAVPTHTVSYAAWGHPPFSPTAAPVHMGIVPTALIKRPEAHRSAHPTHASAAIGKLARALTDNHCISDPLAEQSPLHRVMAWGGKILLLGVGHTSNTSIHLAETLAGMPYITSPYDPGKTVVPLRFGADGSVEEVPQEQYPGCSDAFYLAESYLKEQGRITYGAVGNAVAQLMSSRELIETIHGILAKDATFLLCHSPRCTCCPPRRKMMRELQAGAR